MADQVSANEMVPDLEDDFAEQHGDCVLALYRVTQESLANAIRHGGQ